MDPGVCVRVLVLVCLSTSYDISNFTSSKTTTHQKTFDLFLFPFLLIKILLDWHISSISLVSTLVLDFQLKWTTAVQLFTAVFFCLCLSARSKLNRIKGLNFYLWTLIKQRGAFSLLCKCLSGSVWLIQLHLSTAITAMLILWNCLAILATLVEKRIAVLHATAAQSQHS